MRPWRRRRGRNSSSWSASGRPTSLVIARPCSRLWPRRLSLTCCRTGRGRATASAEAALNAYRDFFAQFERATYDNLNIEKRGNFTIADVPFQLVGLGSGTPVEVLWTVVAEFDFEARKYTTHRWFHARDEAVAWISALPTPAGRDRVGRLPFQPRAGLLLSSEAEARRTSARPPDPRSVRP